MGRVCNGSLLSVLTEDQWKEIVYKCLCANITEKQINELIEMGIPKDKIYELLKVGKDCGTCLEDEKDERKTDESTESGSD